MGNVSILGYILIGAGAYSLCVTLILLIIQLTNSKKFNVLHLEWNKKDHME